MESSDEVIKTIIKILKEKKTEEIILLNISDVSDVTEAFIICTAQSYIHSRAVTDEIIKKLKNKGINVHHVEGYELGKWILLDYLDLVIHIFLPKQREYYNLERLWGDVPQKVFRDEN